MIKLEVEEYCHGCPCFAPEADSVGYYYENGRMKFTGNTNVICKHRTYV